MPSKLPKVGSTYYFRRVIPEDLRPYFRTKNGKPRVEFMISLGVKDLALAKQKWLVEAVRIDALIQEAQRLKDAGISPIMRAAAAKASDEIQRLQFEALDEYQANLPCGGWRSALAPKPRPGPSTVHISAGTASRSSPAPSTLLQTPIPTVTSDQK